MYSTNVDPQTHINMDIYQSITLRFKKIVKTIMNKILQCKYRPTAHSNMEINSVFSNSSCLLRQSLSTEGS